MSNREAGIQIYKNMKPKQGTAGWRKSVIYEIMTALKLTEAAAAAVFNVARKRDA